MDHSPNEYYDDIQFLEKNKLINDNTIVVSNNLPILDDSRIMLWQKTKKAKKFKNVSKYINYMFTNYDTELVSVNQFRVPIALTVSVKNKTNNNNNNNMDGSIENSDQIQTEEQQNKIENKSENNTKMDIENKEDTATENMQNKIPNLK